MADASQFGGQLDPGTQFGASFTSEAPADAPAPEAAASSPTFGTGLSFGMGYRQPDPGAPALDQSASLLQQRIDRASKIATNPLAQLFAPDQAAAAREFVPQATEQLQKIQQQKQQQTDIQKQATNFGIPKADQNPFMTNDTIDNHLLERYKDGDFEAANLLKARGKGEWVTDFAGQALDGAGRRLQQADSAATKLSAAGNSQQAYDAVRKSLTPEDTQALVKMGLPTLPEKVADWQGLVQKHGAQFAQAQAQQAQIKQKLNNMTNFDGTVPKDVETASQSDVRLGSSNEPAGFPVRVRSLDGQPGHVAPRGSVREENYGKSLSEGGYSAWNPEREKSFQALTNDENVKGAVNQYNIANRFRKTAMNEDTWKSSAGVAFMYDELGGVARDVAEKSAAAGSVGLTQATKQQQAYIEWIVNKAKSEVGAVRAAIDRGEKDPEKRISDDTKRGLQFIAEENYKRALESTKGRLGGAMVYAGQGGKPLDQIPLDSDLKREVASFHEQGRQDAINGFRALPSMVRGEQRIYFPPGANVQGATAARPPLTAPVQQGTNEPASAKGSVAIPAPSPNQPVTGSPGSGGGVGPSAPVLIAGQQVSVKLPPGASPNFAPNLQRIESGNEREPWRAGAQGSSATGAFQAITTTWNQFKPPGAPTRAADATPQQQADFLSNLTTHNAEVLTASKLPVNDTNLYITHNLGEGAGPKLLTADLSADARSVVGERAAANNPLFFKGRPTVATVLARYQAKMNGSLAPVAGNAPAQSQATAAPALSDPRNAFATQVQAPAMAPSGPSAPGSAQAPDAPQVPTSQADVNPQAAPVNPGSVASEQAQAEGLKNGIELAPALIPGGGLVAGAARVAASGGASAVTKAMEGGTNSEITLAAAGGMAGGVLGESIGRLIGRALRGSAAREVGAAAEILADPHATAATRRQAMQVASHYDLTEQQLVAMRDAVQSGASKAEAALPGGAASEATASARIAPAIAQEHQAATHGYGVVEDALTAAPNAAGVRTNATARAAQAGLDQNPTVMTAARSLDATTANAANRNPIQQYEAVRNVVSGIKEDVKEAPAGTTRNALSNLARIGDRVKEIHVVSALGQADGSRMINYARGSDAMWRDLKTTVQNGDMLRAIGQGEERTSLGRVLLNVVKIGTAGEDAALQAVASLRRITSNAPDQLRAAQELYMREAFAGARAKSDIQTAGREILDGKSSSVARALLSPDQLAAVRRTVENAGQYATRNKGEVGFESALMAGEFAHSVGHIAPGAGLVSAAINLVQLRGNVKMFLRSLPANYKSLVSIPTAPAQVGAAAGGATMGGSQPRQSPKDGKWYIPDPTRQGKYLEVVNHGQP